MLEELTERLSPEGSAGFGLPKNLVRENKSGFHFSIFMDFRINVNYRLFTELACRFVFKPLSLPFLPSAIVQCRAARTGASRRGAAANHDLLALLDLVKQTRKVRLGLMDGDGRAEK